MRFLPVIALAALVLVGCGKPIPMADTRATPDENFNAVWDAAVETLWEYRFEIDRNDRRAGVLTTFPLVGRHWFEFWRKDAATNNDIAEGTLQTMYRQATVTVRAYRPGGPLAEEAASLPTTLPVASAGPATYYVNVVIQTGRSDNPGPMVTCTSEAFELFSGAIATPQPVSEGKAVARPGSKVVEEPTEIGGEHVVDLGRDKNLERIIQEKIIARAGNKLAVHSR